MTKAHQALGPPKPQGNSPPIKNLSRDEAAAALLAMLSGSETIPPLWQLKAIVAAKVDSGPCSLVGDTGPRHPELRQRQPRHGEHSRDRPSDTAIREIEDALGCCLMAPAIKGARYHG
jgi:hypothetical protein